MDSTTVLEWATLIQNIGVPTVLLVFLGVLLWQMVPTLIKYIQSVIEDKKDLAEDRKKRADEAGELRKLIRNTNSVVANNTAALTLAETNNQLVVNVLGKHMDESRDYHQRHENDLCSLENKVNKLVTNIEVIKETK